MDEFIYLYPNVKQEIVLRRSQILGWETFADDARPDPEYVVTIYFVGVNPDYGLIFRGPRAERVLTQLQNKFDMEERSTTNAA